MKELKELYVDYSILPQLIYVKDILYYDGAILSLFKNPYDMSFFLYYWVDFDIIYNRYLVFEVSKSDLENYINGKKCLLQVIKSTSKGYVYKTDIDENLNKYNTSVIKISDIPEYYLPTAESYLSPQ